MKIGFIGAGKVGCSLGLYLGTQNTIVGYASRSYSSAEFAANLTGSKAFGSAIDLAKDCDLLYFTTPDGEISRTWKGLCEQVADEDWLEGTILAHASGSLSSNEFEGADRFGAHAVSTHPLYAISSKTETAKELNKALIVIEGSDGAVETVSELYEDCGNEVQTIPTEQKTRYHAAAVLASNHVVSLYHIATQQLLKCGFSEMSAQLALSPLFLGNANNIAKLGPIQSLTGPAERGDLNTIKNHLQTLEGRAKDVYKLLNLEALEIADQKRMLQGQERHINS